MSLWDFEGCEKMKVIYEPKGKAREYAELAVNIYRGCGHGCEYCYAPNVIKMNKLLFFNEPSLRPYITRQINDDAYEMKKNNDNREVLMCFTCDPYQPEDVFHQATRKAIQSFVHHGRHFSILTKGGKRSERDFDLLAEHPGLCRYGATLVFCNDEHSKKYEPFAAITSERIESLKKAHELGIKTWVSLEPAWSYADVSDLIKRTADFVDEYKIGKLNYHAHAKEINWKEFKEEVVDLCEFLGVNYTLKNDLAVL